VLADLSRTNHERATEAATDLLLRAGVASIAGTAFFEGAAGDRFLRFCFAKEDDVLTKRAPGSVQTPLKDSSSSCRPCSTAARSMAC